MTYKYFNPSQTVEEIKKAYKKLALQLHPDKGGSTEQMQALNAEYEKAIKMAANGQRQAGKMTSEEFEATILEAEAYREALEKIIHLEGLIIEVIGSWIWVTGLTHPHRSTKWGGTGILPEAGYLWAPKKQAWFFRTEEYKSPNRRKMDLDEIRTKYGSTKITGAPKNNFLNA